MVVTETNRLQLTKFSKIDIDGFFELNNDCKVLKFTGDKPFRNKEDVSRFISGYRQYDLYGFGRWSLYLKNNNQYIGFSGLRYVEKANEVDIGFRIARRFWGKGYATESAEAVLKMAFVDHNLERVVARAMGENVASHSVIKKLGMRYYSEFEEDGCRWIKYELKRENWLINNRNSLI